MPFLTRSPGAVCSPLYCHRADAFQSRQHQLLANIAVVGRGESATVRVDLDLHGVVLLTVALPLPALIAVPLAPLTVTPSSVTILGTSLQALGEARSACFDREPGCCPPHRRGDSLWRPQWQRGTGVAAMYSAHRRHSAECRDCREGQCRHTPVRKDGWWSARSMLAMFP